MPDTLSTFAPAQKEKYVGIVNEVLNSKQQLWGWLDKVPADGGGTISTLNTGSVGTTTQRGLHFTVHLGRNATGSFQDPEANFPTSGNQQYVQGYMQGRTIYWPMQVSRAAIARTKSDDAAYARVMVEAAVRTGNDLRNELDRASYGDGSGTLGVLTSTAPTVASNTALYTLDNAQDLRKFYIGQVLSFYSNRTNGASLRTIITGGTATITTAVKVTAISTTAGTITVGVVGSGTLTAAYTPTAGDVIAKASVDTSASTITVNGERTATTRYGMMGIDGIVLDCDSPMESGGSAGLFGILAPTQYGTATVNSQGAAGTANSGGYPTWSAYTNRSTSNRAFNDALLMSLFDRPMIDYGERPNLITTSYGGRWEYVNSKLGIRRYVNTPALAGQTSGGFTENEDSKGFTEFNDVPIVPGRYSTTWNYNQLNTLSTNFYALNLNTLKVYEWHPIRFMDDDGLTWRMIQRTPFFEAILEYTCEMMTFARNSHAKATNIIASDFQ